MSKVSEILGANKTGDKCLVIYDSCSVDSIIGAGIIKYICENITDVAENVICQDLMTEISGELTEYTDITYVGCVPDTDLIKTLGEVFGKNALFVTCDKLAVSLIRSASKKVSVEYSENDSCSLNLYKIAYGEFEDKVPSLIKIVSDGALYKFTNDYNDYLGFCTGVLNKTFSDMYDIVEMLCEQESTDEAVSNIIREGNTLLQNEITSILKGKTSIVLDKWTVGSILNAYAIWSNGPISEAIIQSFTDADAIINFYRKGNNVDVELLKIEHSEYSEELDTITLRIADIDVALQETPNNFDLIKELKQKISRKEILEYLLSFDCGRYLAKAYSGTGSASHGHVTVSYKVFKKLLDTKTL